jgi:TatD DNase family protein
MWTDSHCHLQDEDDAVEGYERAVEAGVDRIILIGTGPASSMRAVESAVELSSRDQDGEVYATVGQHPHQAAEGVEAIASLLQGYHASGLCSDVPGSVVGVGECGLDYYYERSPREAQREVFAAQIELARLADLTLVVHTRDAWDDTFALLAEAGLPDRLVIHCFSGGPAEARRCLELGAYLSFSGIVTFKNAGEVREAAALCPADRLLTETDAPYLAPVPHRGRPNEPALVAVVGEALAELRGVAVAELAETSSRNAASAFRLSG